MKTYTSVATSLLLAVANPALSGPVPEIERAINSINLDDEGFIEKVVACTDISHVIEHETRGDDNFYPDYFIVSSSKPEYRKLFFNYFKRNGKHPFDELYEIRSRPLSKKIERHFNSMPVEEVMFLCTNASYLFMTNLRERSMKGGGNTSLHLKTGAIKSADTHQRCLDGKDYKGCISSLKGEPIETTKRDWCLREKGPCRVQTKGNDAFGLNKPMGWNYISSDDGEQLYYWSDPYRVIHKNYPARYLVVKRITRWYQSPEAGTPEISINGNSSTIRCTDFGYSSAVGYINCTTTRKSRVQIPGKEPIPGGNISVRFNTVYDCRDNTTASYEGNRLMSSGWEVISSKTSWPVEILRSYCKSTQAELMSLPSMQIKL